MTFRALFLFAAFAFVSSLSAQVFTWSAWSGLPPQSGTADGPALAARFYRPAGVVVTDNGFVMIADALNGTIRMLSPDGQVTTLAGSPRRTGSSDGVGSAARFRAPWGLTVLGGWLYVTDRYNHSIRRITPTGAVTTYAGANGEAGAVDGPAALARFNEPLGITDNGTGGLYVVDRLNHAIRRIDANGNVTTFAGLLGSPGSADGPAADARFLRPTGITRANNGDLFVTDSGNHTIRRITAAGVVSTWAGSAGFPGTANGQGPAARFEFPGDLVLFGDGSLLVADTGNHSIRQITADRTVSLYSGRLNVEGYANGSLLDARYYVPTAIAQAPGNSLIVVDAMNHSLRRISSDTTVTLLAGGGGNFGRSDGTGPRARFNFPQGVAVHSSGDVYVADGRGNSLRRIFSGGETLTILPGTASAGTYLDGPAGTATTDYPSGVAVGADRTLYFCEYQSHTIRRMRASGEVETIAGRPGVAGSADGRGEAARFRFPTGVAVDEAGNVFVADSNSHVIRRIAAGNDVVTTFAGLPGSPGSADGRGNAARFRFPRGLCVDRGGNVYVADAGNHLIRMITTDGQVSTFAGVPESSGTNDGPVALARFTSPDAVAHDGKGSLFVADRGNDTIRRIAGGVVTTIGGSAGIGDFAEGSSTSAWFSAPSGIAVADDGAVYVTEAENNVVRRGRPQGHPAFVSQPVPVTVSPGQPAEFQTQASGFGFSYQWRFNGAPIAGATSATLWLPSAQSSHAGEYTVTIANGVGSIKSAPARLTVLAPDATPGRIVNLSILTRLSAPGDNFTLGYVVANVAADRPKPLLIRAAGPALGALGIPDTLTDPRLELFADGRANGGNDNWAGAASVRTTGTAVGAFALATETSLDAAMIFETPARENSVRVSATDNGSGLVLAEIYDAALTSVTAASPRLANVSVLKHLGTGLTAGFVVGGHSPVRVLIRAVGPTLGAAPFHVPDVVSDVELTLYAGQQIVRVNDDWGGSAELTAAFARVGAFSLPASSHDAAVLVTLEPGLYSVAVKGVGENTGRALVEIYDVR